MLRRVLHSPLLIAAILFSMPATGLEAQGSPPARLVGVFDELSGEPLQGVEVMDYATGTKAYTTSSGAVSLWFIRQSPALLVIRRIGYDPIFFPVNLGPSDTAAITITLKRVTRLPEVVARSKYEPGDTVRRLMMSGFYDRRISSAVAASSFITAEDIAKIKPMLFSDLGKRMNRDFQRCRWYLDGMVIATEGPGTRAGRNTFRRGIDAFIDPQTIAGLEVYRPGAVPAHISRTWVGATPECVGLIWTK
jgi:hypothetical protein